MEYILCRIKKAKSKNKKKFKKILHFYFFIIVLLIIYILDTMLFNIPSNNTQTVVGKANIIQVIPKTNSGTYPKIILDINGERYVLYHRSSFKEVSYGYSELAELIKNEDILKFMVEEQKNIFPAKQGDLKSIVDIRNDKNIYVDIEDTNEDKIREIIATIIIAVFLFLGITFLLFLRIFLIV